jgi:hypothetical protein
MDSRYRRAKAVSRLWDAVTADTADNGEMSAWEWVWVVNELHGRFVAMGLRAELGGAGDEKAGV